MKKRIICLALLFSLTFLLLGLPGCGGDKEETLIDNTFSYSSPELNPLTQAANSYYVSPNGLENGLGTKESPFLYVQSVIDAVRKHNENISGDVKIFLDKGKHYLGETIKLTEKDNLKNGGKIEFTSVDLKDRGTISAGRKVENFVKSSLNGKTVYKAKISDLTSARGFSVNGKRKPIASAFSERNRINKFANLASWSWGDSAQNSIKLMGSYDLTTVKNPSQLEAAMICEWKTFVFKASEVVDSSMFKLLQPYASWLTTPASVGNLDPGGYWFPNPKHGLWLQNDVSLIDTPGEWCFDQKEKIIYYMPVEGEVMENAECEISNLDKLMTIYGDKASYNPAKNIAFTSIGFSGAGFAQLDKQGIGMVQGQSYYSGITEVAGDSGPNVLQPVPQTYYNGDIHTRFSENIVFSDCYFSNTSKAAIDFDTGTKNSSVSGSAFLDLGDAAVVVSNCHQGSSDKKDLVDNITIKNNLIRRVGRINQTSAAIDVYKASNVTIEHNDIYDCPNTGIHIGWGWYIDRPNYIGNHKIGFNRVGYTVNSSRDGGAIYTLGITKNNSIYGNYVYDQRSAYGGIYLDEGSCGWTVTNNLIDNKWDPDYDEALVWLRLNGMAGGPGGSTTVFSNTVTNNYYTNIAETNNGNSAAGYENTVKDNEYIFGVNNEHFPKANPEWSNEVKAIFEFAGLEEKYKNLFTLYNEK